MKILLIAYDNGSYMTFFPQGLAYITAYLEDEGHEVKIYQQDLHHYSKEHLLDFLNKNNYDAIGVGVIGGYWQYKKMKEISWAINSCKQRNKMTYVIAGYGPSPEPEFFLRKMNADVCVIGEGEITAVELFNAIANNKSFEGITGTCYIDAANKFIMNSSRSPISNIENIKRPRFEKFPIEIYRLRPVEGARPTDFVMPVLSGRGCTFKCNFCYRMDKGYRQRAAESIIDEINLLKRDYGITYIIFNDDLLMTTKQRTIELMESFIRANNGNGIGVKWYCNARLNFAVPEVLTLMKRAGAFFNNYGIETFDQDVWNTMKKGLTKKIVIDGVRNTYLTGIKPGLNMIWGNIGETVETLQKAVNFLLEWDDGTQKRTIRPVTPYPGSPLYYHAIKHGLLDCNNPAEDFYENKHTNSDLLTCNFTALSDDEFHIALYEANKTLLTNYYNAKKDLDIAQAYNLYYNHDTSFRGFRTFGAGTKNITIGTSKLKKIF